MNDRALLQATDSKREIHIAAAEGVANHAWGPAKGSVSSYAPGIASASLNGSILKLYTYNGWFAFDLSSRKLVAFNNGVVGFDRTR